MKRLSTMCIGLSILVMAGLLAMPVIAQENTNQVRVREGRLNAYRPEILTPSSFMENALEGFTEAQASEYLDWLREHERELMILNYGFKIRVFGYSSG